MSSNVKTGRPSTHRGFDKADDERIQRRIAAARRLVMMQTRDWWLLKHYGTIKTRKYKSRVDWKHHV